MSSDRRPTLLLDESDTYLQPGSSGYRDDLRAVIAAGYRPGSHVVRCELPSMRERIFETFTAVAIAGLGRLPEPILQRSIVFPMHTRRSDEPISSFRYRIEHEKTELVREQLTAWGDDNFNRATDLLAGQPLVGLEGLADRQFEIWEPLAGIGDLAGGDWPDRARNAALEITNSGAQRDLTLGVQLLTDIRRIIDGHGKIASSHLVKALNEVEESPWGGWPLDTRGLARRLKPYGVRPAQVRVGERTLKGYRAADFEDPFGRYLLPGETNETRETPQAV